MIQVTYGNWDGIFADHLDFNRWFCQVNDMLKEQHKTPLAKAEFFITEIIPEYDDPDDFVWTMINKGWE